MQFRSLSSSDLGELFGILSTSLVYDNLTEDLVKFRIFEDPDFDPSLSIAAIVDEKIVSFVSASRPTNFPPGNESNPQIAWIKVFATAQKFRNRGYASALFNQIQDELKKRGVTEIRFSDRGNWHFWPGIDLRYEDGLDFLERRGFSKDSEELDYLYNLRLYTYPHRVSRVQEQLQKDSIDLRTASPSEKQELCDWIERQFTIFWSNETEYAFAKRNPSVVIAKDRRGNILGFATFDGVAPGRFGPTGVDQSQRGRGLGTVLLFDAFQAMREAGQEMAVVHWTDLLFFYTQIPGLCGVRDYWIMHRGL